MELLSNFAKEESPRPCALSESIRPNIGLPNIRYGTPTLMPVNRHSSSVTHLPGVMKGSNGDAAISELARRILRSTGVKIIHDGGLTQEIEALASELSDKAPKIIFGIESEIGDSADIYFLNMNSQNGIISQKPPKSLEIVWIKGGNEKWNNLQKKIVELGRAGYPGCIGCAGPAASEPWDEVMSRKQIF